MLTAKTILNAIHGGDIESIRKDDKIVVLIDRKPAMRIPADPKPEVRRDGTAVVVTNGAAPPYVLLIGAETRDEAVEIFETMAHLIGAAT